MKIQETHFRDMYHKIFYISANANYDLLAEKINGEVTGNGTIVYGYVDHQMGMCYEILALAEKAEDGMIRIVAYNDAQTLKSQYETVMNCEYEALPEDMDLSMFKAKTRMVDRLFRYNETMEALRDIDMIDHCRNEEFPDDMLVYLVGEDRMPETCWVRSEKVEEGMVHGILLNEPKQYFGVHEKGEITFCTGNLDGKYILVAEIENIPMLIL